MGGIVTAVLYTDPTDPLSEALDVAHDINKALRGSTVVRVDELLVSIGDIADRLGVSSEAVRLSSSEKRRARTRSFPLPHAVVSQDAH